MNIPSLMLGFLISSLYGVLFHLVRGGGPTRLLIYLFISWVGFTVGHFAGVLFRWILFPIGQLNFGAATIGSIVFLALSLTKLKGVKNKDDAV
jgi:hypothetical protein